MTCNSINVIAGHPEEIPIFTQIIDLDIDMGKVVFTQITIYVASKSLFFNLSVQGAEIVTICFKKDMKTTADNAAKYFENSFLGNFFG
jgi:hypothetical protein